MGDELASKMPPTIIYTTEFDSFRPDAQQAAEVYGKNGTLLDYGTLPGTFEAGAREFENFKRCNDWYHAVGAVAHKYLV